MSEPGTTLSENGYVKELLTILDVHGKDASGLEAILGYVADMEAVVRQAESVIRDMKTQLDTVRELQGHPFKGKLRSTLGTLESRVAELKTWLSEMKQSILAGCQEAVSAFKAAGASALNEIASFFRIKPALEAMRNNAVKGIDTCDRAIASIEAFASEYHAAGRSLKNMARMAVGKDPIDQKKEAGRIAKAVSAPYKAEKKRLLRVRQSVSDSLKKLEALEKRAEDRRTQRENQPKLAQRIAAKKAEIKQRDLEKKVPAYTPRRLEI